MSKSKVFLFEGDDPEMTGASENARATFKYFWRELAWERRRIIPALDVACVKAAFADEGPSDGSRPQQEHMWIENIDFDGKLITGNLLNSPNWLQSIKAGDQVALTIDQITDWMYAAMGEVYGAYTVNLIRSRMDKRERKAHDAAWGLKFGDPAVIRVVPDHDGSAVIGEHPMSENMAPAIRDEIDKDSSFLIYMDDRGWTILHEMALAGSLAAVAVLIEKGADINAKTTNGMTPLALANSLKWENVAAILRRNGAQ